ncbi:thioesterase II family protein [Streptomyces cyaneofuscatus]|uniref:thioesterase II family protein n=1 Tax=Streptomyces cyaneofuscatus TaxID=66883 RepID=UPI003805B24E
MKTQRTKSTWLPFGTPPEADIALLCLPHSGAGASAYRAWGQGMPERIGVCPVQPPGRETRRQEPPLRDVGSIVPSLARDVAVTVEGPYAVFGHSTGAICAFELCREIRRMGGPQPEHLFIAGRRAPQLQEKHTKVGELTTEQLAEVLREHGGTPDWVLNDPAMLRMLHPVLTADFEVSEGYVYSPEPPLDLPITAFAATDDPRGTVAQLAAWEPQTTREFTLHELQGDHFAIFQQADRVHTAVAQALGHS